MMIERQYLLKTKKNQVRRMNYFEINEEKKNKQYEIIELKIVRVDHFYLTMIHFRQMILLEKLLK
jgi:hypothetical protein